MDFCCQGWRLINCARDPSISDLERTGWSGKRNSIEVGKVTFVDGDVFGARAKADGDVEVYRNGTLLGTRDVSSWPYYDDGGYIGIFTIDADDAILDDFGGGTIITGFADAAGSGITLLKFLPKGSDASRKAAGGTPREARISYSLKPMTSPRSAQKVLAKQMRRTLGKQILAAGSPPYGTIYRSYYFAGSQRVAVRVQESEGGNEVYYLLSDHLGSTSVSYRASDGLTQKQYYKPWGEIRPATSGNVLPTDYTYTGQRSDGYINLIWMNSRWYDPALGRFTQPDTIVPVDVQGTQAWDRFAYVNNNPLRYTDPTGHGAYCGDDYDPGCLNKEEKADYMVATGQWPSNNPPYLPTPTPTLPSSVCGQNPFYSQEVSGIPNTPSEGQKWLR